MTLQQHLSSGNTTVCYCWVIIRQDGVTKAFTDHDEDVIVDGYTCSAATGILTTTLSQSLGMEDDTMDVDGVIDDEDILTDDVRSGLYDGATVKIYIVNWSDPTEFYHIGSGTFGNLVETEGGAFQTEFRSLTHSLAQVTGRTFQRTCDAKIGDARCGIDLDNVLYRVDDIVVSALDDTIVMTDLSGYDDGWFGLGTIETADGRTFDIREHVADTIYLWAPLPVTIDSGDTLIIRAGCRQTVTVCRDKFNNVANFRGFPSIPGNDALTSYPIHGRDEYDGDTGLSDPSGGPGFGG